MKTAKKKMREWQTKSNEEKSTKPKHKEQKIKWKNCKRGNKGGIGRDRATKKKKVKKINKLYNAEQYNYKTNKRTIYRQQKYQLTT